MFCAQIETLKGERIHKFRLLRSDAPMSYAAVLASWSSDADFRRFFIRQLAESRFVAFRWETPPVTRTSAERDFEFVLLKSDLLDRPADPYAFADQFTTADVVVFPNLGADAVMVVPCPVAGVSSYGHLAAFVRHAPETQVHHLWQAIGVAMQERLGDRPVWLNTAGMGVAWLHVRLDDRPKYYGYTPFRQADC